MFVLAAMAAGHEDLLRRPHVLKHSCSVLKRLELPPQPPYQKGEHASMSLSKNHSWTKSPHWKPVSTCSWHWAASRTHTFTPAGRRHCSSNQSRQKSPLQDNMPSDGVLDIPDECNVNKQQLNSLFTSVSTYHPTTKTSFTLTSLPTMQPVCYWGG